MKRQDRLRLRGSAHWVQEPVCPGPQWTRRDPRKVGWDVVVDRLGLRYLAEIASRYP
jgi:hypothetical protein